LPLYGNGFPAGAYEADNAFVAYEAVPSKLPVNEVEFIDVNPVND
jgi:hypothetical protein